MPTTQPTDFLDESTIGVMGVAAAGVFAATVVARKVFRINHPVVPFVISLAISYGLAATNGKLNTFLGLVVAFLNACMLFCAAVGANETATNIVTPKPAGAGEQQGRVPMPLLKSLFRR